MDNHTTKICKDCKIEKDISCFQSQGIRNGKKRFRAECKECTKLRRKDYQRPVFHFVCKNCGKDSSSTDQRWTTFCSRECNYAYKSVETHCKRCDKIIANYTVYCPECKESMKSIREANKLKHKLALENRRIQRAIIKAAHKVKRAKEQSQPRFKKCPECNMNFPYSRQKYCSDKCKRIVRNRKWYEKDKKRYELMVNNGPVDWDIDLKGLAKRDNNICYICNEKVNWKDFRITNTFIAQPKYPSIDHIVALTNGGTHTWSNIKLAHFGCNSMKRDSIITIHDNQLTFFI